MTLGDLVDVSLRNLWRVKLRAALTIAGVVIAIATFVAMLSFAAGNHRYFKTAFSEFGLLSQMSVRPQRGEPSDTTDAAILNNEAVRNLSAIPGVRFAYPYSTFDVTVSVRDTVISTRARSIPAEALDTKLFQRVLGGQRFSSESAREAIITREFVEGLDTDPFSLVGETVIVSVRVANVDSAIAASLGDPLVEAQRLYVTVDRDSMMNLDYRRRFATRELGGRLGSFFDALMNRRSTVSDTLVITGVAPDDEKYRIQTSPIVITQGSAERLSSQGLVMGNNPADLLSSVRDGRLFDVSDPYDKRSYPRVTLELEPLANHASVRDSVDALGYQAVSFAESFEAMQRFMVYYYLGMGVIGLIALFTASLGIINTLVMSITERRREIGILKSLGAYEGDIRRLFLVESGVIGLIGAGTGILIGWGTTRIVAAVARAVMTRQEMPVFDPFALPLWLVGVALGFGLLVSLIAGLYPASRAARVDPVEALRSE